MANVRESTRGPAAAAGGLHTLALTRDGHMVAFGFGRWGQLGLGVEQQHNCVLLLLKQLS